MAAATESLKQFAFEEVKQHSNRASCWLVIHDRVYDVTPFLNEVCTFNVPFGAIAVRRSVISINAVALMFMPEASGW